MFCVMCSDDKKQSFLSSSTPDLHKFEFVQSDRGNDELGFFPQVAFTSFIKRGIRNHSGFALSLAVQGDLS